MKRYNIFNQVHKGLRALLYETIIKLQQTDFTDAEDADEAVQQVKIILDLFDEHAHTEDTFILPAIVEYEPSVVDAFAQEHVKDLALSNKLNGLLQAFSLTISPDAKREIGAAISNAVFEFMLFNLEHMKKEEDVLNKLLWRYYDDEVLHGITMKIIAHVPADKMPLYNKWMMRGLSNTEIIGWLKQVKNNAPEFVFDSFVDLAVNELAECRWQKIQEQLTEGAMLA
ncbi:hemerythrin domain-containing protein [Lacibacter sediminis]|uniref:Hemerythrin domain-containing protein n=1 Tax=Lacibacter sediminis TaxID=2760713 RepID=A0A7G5XHY4_9BACT|nr:hemerythrin domain-containing protein [Lacibacter sediminis]QNA45087.1 hemerythrin domain-containing protein [Lacibacter sediminis]